MNQALQGNYRGKMNPETLVTNHYPKYFVMTAATPVKD